MPKKLRYYQQDALEAIWQNLDKKPLISVPTGGGKSLIIAELVRRIHYKYTHINICMIVPRAELVNQNYDELVEQAPDIDVGIYCAGLNSKEQKTITIGTIQSLHRMKRREINFNVFIVDEAHLIPKSDSGMFHRFFANYENHVIVGLTATPYRTGSGLLYEGEGRLFEMLAYRTDIKKLIGDGYLSPLVSMDGDDVANTSNLKLRAGEFISSEVEAIFHTNNITSNAVKHMLSKTKTRRSVLVFANSVKHAMEIHNMIGDNNLSRVVTGGTTKKNRKEFIRLFKERKIKYLVNCEVYTTGFNAPNVDCIVLLRATASASLYVQMVGRGLRIARGKEDCLLLDYGRNIERFGTIENVLTKSKNWKCGKCNGWNSEDAKVKCIHCGQLRRVSSEQDTDINDGKPGWTCKKCFQSGIIEDECPECGLSFSDNRLIKNTEDDKIKRYKVVDMDIDEHFSGKGVTFMRVNYHCQDNLALQKTFSLYLLPNPEKYQDKYPQKGTQKFFKKKFAKWRDDHNFRYDDGEITLQAPGFITVDNSDKYPKITDYDFRGSFFVEMTDNQKIDESEFDEIPF